MGFWPRRLGLAWRRAEPRGQLLWTLSLILLGASLAALLWPYWRAAEAYGFRRSWSEVALMLPTWRSYLVADRAQLWKPVSTLILGLPMRHEHQLFPGMAALISAGLGLASLVSLREHRRRGVVVAHFWAGALLVALTLTVHGFSLYVLLWILPGVHNVRAVSRISLILMWPLALVISCGIEILTRPAVRLRMARVTLAVCLLALMIAESVFFDHATFGKAELQAELRELREQLPPVLPDQPVLYLAQEKGDPAWKETVGMLLAQDLGWPTLNGYSSYSPPYSDPATYRATQCSSLPNRILSYMRFARIDSSQGYYLAQIKRIVPVGFDDCDPRWWRVEPSAAPSSISGSGH